MIKLNMLFDIEIILWGMTSGSRSGLFWVAYNLLKKFSEDDRFTITLYTPNLLKNNTLSVIKHDRLLKHFPIVNIYRCIQDTKKDRFFLLPNPQFNINKYDCYFHPYSQWAPLMDIQSFIIIHDVTPLLYPSYCYESCNLQNNTFYLHHTKILSKSNIYICISNNTRKEFLKFFGNFVNEKNIYSIHIAQSTKLFPDHDKCRFDDIANKYKFEILKNKKYILTLCRLAKNKGLPFTIKCFIKFIEKYKINDLFFLIVSENLSVKNDVYCKIQDISQKYNGKILLVGYIDENDLSSLYSNAYFFTFISEHEGFGLPPLEAMTCGTPVITSNRASLPEVVGDAGIMIDPDDENACIASFAELYFNTSRHDELSAKGLERAKKFSWSRTQNSISKIILHRCARNF
jgi:glycosyltransferase involved in cell wall biosynthesis